MVAPGAVLAAMIRAGAQIWRSPAVQEASISSIAGAGRTALARNMLGASTRVGVENYLVGQAATKTFGAAANLARRHPGVAGAEQTVRAFGRGAAHKTVGTAANSIASRAQSVYASAVARNIRFEPGATGYTVRNRVLEREIAARQAYHSPWGRAGRSMLNRFAADYAAIQAINVSTTMAQNAVSRAKGEEERALAAMPYQSGDDVTLEQLNQITEGDLQERSLNVALTALVSSWAWRGASAASRATAGRITKANRVPFRESVTPSQATTFGRRMGETAQRARSYYGTHAPEVAGELLGATTALTALGADPLQISTALGARGIANVGVGFYNYGPYRGPDRLPTFTRMARGAKVARVKTTRKAKRATRRALG